MIGLIVIFMPLISGLIVWSLRRSEKSSGDAALVLSRISVGLFIALALLRITRRVPATLDFGNLIHYGKYRLDSEWILDLRALCVLGLSSFLFWIILRFARVYLHREAGFNRFFRTLFLSHFGMNLLATAGNADLFFAGWEVVGLTSFLLIGFYRDRATPVLNAFRTYVVYRICDVGILLGGYLLRENPSIGDRFHSVDAQKMMELAQNHPGMAWALGLAILLPALGKSAQFPFSFWLPRALEGPTPSSAVFYGALSIHAGVFLLLRTQEIWLQLPMIRMLIFIFGAISLGVATLAGRAQANIKGQIGYASISQVGIMFMEAALGWTNWVLFHLCSHAVLRTYQFLTSPSVVTHFIRHPVPETKSGFYGFTHHPWIRRLSVGEFFLEETWNRVLVRPLLGLSRSNVGLAAFLGVSYGLMAVYSHPHEGESNRFAALILVLALGCSLKSIGINRDSKRLPWVMASILGALTSAMLVERSAPLLQTCAWGLIPGILLWFSGKMPLRFFGWLCLAGFPISTFFAGDDLIVHSLGELGWIGLLVFGLIYILNGVSLSRAWVGTAWLPHARPLD